MNDYDDIIGNQGKYALDGILVYLVRCFTFQGNAQPAGPSGLFDIIPQQPATLRAGRNHRSIRGTVGMYWHNDEAEMTTTDCGPWFAIGCNREVRGVG